MKILRIPLVIVLMVVAGRAFNANAQTVTNLHSFGGCDNDGANPHAGLVQGSDGNFYGTTSTGGTGSDWGTVFRISPSGTETTLWSFANGVDGGAPFAPLVQGSDGNFYGTTTSGGTSTNCGTIFRISPSGTLTTLYSFGGTPDGAHPYTGLARGRDGNFYGTTEDGGTSTNCDGGCGTIFRISPSGSYTNLYSFGSTPNDGLNPFAGGLVQGSDGYFYGTTGWGGARNSGTIFRISPSGSYTILYSFGSPPDYAEDPRATLVQGSDGNFYGTTTYSGRGYGTVFRFNPSGSLTTLYSFGGSPEGGRRPNGLVQGSDGNLYGTTSDGASGYATVFRITPGGSLTNLWSFTGGLYGVKSDAPLVQGIDGNFYGTTSSGGASVNGTVFRLSVPLSPPANQISAVQIQGANFIVTIPSVAGETYQLQFSSSMTPTNWVNVPGVSVTNSIGALLVLTNFGGASQSQGFYRFDITP